MNRAVVLGMARSGQAAAALLERNGVEVVRADRSLGNDEDLSLLVGADVLVKSPGVPRSAALVAAARIPIWSEVELAAHYLPNPILGVTGTNGKTTTSEWLGAMFRAAGSPVAVAGNVGRALSGVEAPPDAWIVCELSSFQLEDVHEFRPRVAVLINLEPDHLDRHGTFEEYRAAKLRIFENQTAEDTAVVPRGFDQAGRARRVEFAATDELPAEPGLPGGHNRENAAAATAAARAAGVPDDAIAEALR
ncbi:MAG: Mur ligase family protein, partial [Gaiellaceae bacterium]